MAAVLRMGHYSIKESEGNRRKVHSGDIVYMWTYGHACGQETKKTKVCLNRLSRSYLHSIPQPDESGDSAAHSDMGAP